MTIAAFLEAHPEFEPVKVEAPWFIPGPNGTFRMWPHKIKGEGHFGAVLKKVSGEETKVSLEPAQRIPEEWTAFARDNALCLPEGKAVLFGQNLYWAPAQLPSIRGVRVLRPGLELGEVKKGRFQPAHALALWLKEAKNVEALTLDDPAVTAYFHGDTIATNCQGWCLVTVDGYSAGWGKGDKNVLKNHYPKGLRR